jgi:hypothetical protein
VVGLARRDMHQYLQYIADRRLQALRLPARYHVANPLPFMELQDVQELTNFFERRVSAYQVAVPGQVGVRSGILSLLEVQPRVCGAAPRLIGASHLDASPAQPDNQIRT